MPRPPVAPLTAALCLIACAGCDDRVAYEPEPEPQSSSGAGTGSGATDDGSGAQPSDAPADAPAGAVLRTVTPMEALEILQDPPEDLVVLDVRTAAEFDNGHLEGAIQIDFYGDDFEQEIGALDKGVPYLLYCQSGGRSGQTLTIMGNLGFEEVYEIEGGYGAWAAEGLPVVED